MLTITRDTLLSRISVRFLVWGEPGGRENVLAPQPLVSDALAVVGLFAGDLAIAGRVGGVVLSADSLSVDGASVGDLSAVGRAGLSAV